MWGTRPSSESMGKESEWEFDKKAWKARGGQGPKRLAPRTGALLGLVLESATGRACGRKGFRLSQATGPSPDFLKGHSASPSVPFVADPQLTRGLGVAVAGSPGDSAASAILARLLLRRSHRPLRNRRRGGPSWSARHHGRIRHRKAPIPGWRAGLFAVLCPPVVEERFVSSRFASSGPRVPPDTLPLSHVTPILRLL